MDKSIVEQRIREAKAHIESGNLDLGISVLEELRDNCAMNDAVAYELGNAYWKRQDWKRCLDSYACAIKLNPDSPATEMRKMVLEILQFYNKEMFNP